MSKGNTFENDLLKLIFQGTAISGLARNATSGALTNLQVALHTADPGEAGGQSTSEASYGGYVRKAVARSTAGWSISNNQVAPVANIEFATATSGSQTITHASVGTATSGAGKILWSGAVTPNISVGVGVTPRLLTTSLISED